VINKTSRENYTRVTAVLSPFSGLDKIDPEVVRKAGERGTLVHKICEAIISNIGEFGSEDVKGYITSFKKWWEQGHEVVEMEKRFYDDELKLTGQIDLILNTPDGLAIVDLKTSYKPSKTWKAQGSAYAYLASKGGYNIKKIYFLHLNKFGKFPMIYEYPVDDNFFLNIFEVYKYFFGEEDE